MEFKRINYKIKKNGWIEKIRLCGKREVILQRVKITDLSGIKIKIYGGYGK